MVAAAFVGMTTAAPCQVSAPGTVSAPAFPAVYPPNSYVNALSYPGVDMCAKIAAAAGALYAANPAGGVIDATGFIGTQACAGSISTGWPNDNSFNVTIKSNAVLIRTAVTQVIPPSAQWVGQSGIFNSGTFALSFQVSSSSFAANTPVVDFGNASYTNGAGLINATVTCQPPTGSAPSGCIGVRNLYGEENATIAYVNVYGATDTCFDIESNGTGGPQDSGQYHNLGCGQATGVALPAAARCIRIGGATSTQVISGLYQLSCAGNEGVAQAASLVAIEVNGQDISIADSHVESYVTGISVGPQRAASNVRVSNFYCAGSASYPMTSCIDVSAAHASVGLTFVNIDTSANVTNIVKDNLTKGLTVAAGSGPMSQYSRDLSNFVFGIPGGAWVQDTSVVPTASAGSGTFTSASSVINTQQMPGRVVAMNGTITITTAGSGTGSVHLTIPYTPVGDTACNTFEYNAGMADISYINSGAATLIVYGPAYADPIGNSKLFKFNCTFQSQ